MAQLNVLGSSGEVHQVTVEKKKNGTVGISCSCIAGQKNTMCKHRHAFIMGDASVLNGDQKEAWQEARTLIDVSPIVQNLLVYEQHLKDNKKAQDDILKKVEKELAPLKEEAKNIKKLFVVMLERGM